jgi:hypothetical protein
MHLYSNSTLTLLIRRALQNILTSLEIETSSVPSRPNLGDFKGFVTFPPATIDATIAVFFASIVLTRISFDELFFLSRKPLS